MSAIVSLGSRRLSQIASVERAWSLTPVGVTTLTLGGPLFQAKSCRLVSDPRARAWMELDHDVGILNLDWPLDSSSVEDDCFFYLNTSSQRRERSRGSAFHVRAKLI